MMKNSKRSHGATATADPVSGRTELQEDLAQLHALLEKTDIAGARDLVQQLAAKWPESDRVQHLARVLAPPVVTTRPGRPGHSRQQERAWLQEHAREYAGCWLALLGAQLIKADADLAVVLAVLDSVPHGQDALLHFEPGSSD